MENYEINDPYGFIYITTNMINGKRYIGQKRFDNKSRWKSYLGSGFHLINAFKTYGRENFSRDIVDISFSLEELNRKEKEWIINHNAVNDENYYNLIDGGNVLESLKGKNSIRVVCIDTNQVFNSIAEASLWSGYTSKKIKDSFKKKHTYYDYKNEDYIFRNVPDNKINKRVCSICGKFLNADRHWCKTCAICEEGIQNEKDFKNCLDCGIKFKSNNNRHTRCEKCSKLRNKEKTRLRVKKSRESKLNINGGMIIEK